MESTLEIITDKRGIFMVMAPMGRMDNETSPRFQEKAEKIMALGEKRFVVDLAGLEYLSSAGMRALIATAMQLRSIPGSSIAFARPAAMVTDVLRVSGFEQMFPLFSTLDEALKA